VFDTDDIPSNESANPHLADMIGARVSRRALFGGAAAIGLVGLLGRSTASADGASDDADDAILRRPLLGFTGIDPSTDDTVRVPDGYSWQVLIPWGTPLVAGVTYQEDASNTAADQAQQVGFNHDGMHYFPLESGRDGSRRGLLVLNHEYTDASQIYTAAQGSAITNDEAGREKVAKALAGHGVTVVEIRQLSSGQWTHVVGSKYNRRITGTTPVAFSGPVSASHPALASTISPTPRGTLNNCANGYTPWGTYLTCEENWNGYFGTTSAGTPVPANQARYGVSAAGFGYNWHLAEPRFDYAVNPNELNHFGWVVEIDPFNPKAAPVKRTALGRVKHESATVTESQGRVVVYTGDDENGEYVYKFVGDRPWRQHRARGRSPLDHGTLYVAKFNADGSGEWLPLVFGQGALVAPAFADQADVLIRTRQAADALGATKCHRPEWVAVDEKTKDVYVTFTNGSNNPAPVNSNRNPNPYGHIVHIAETAALSTATTFQWDIFVAAGDPAYDATVPSGQTIFGSPDGLWVDPDGRLWIQTDISNGSQNLASRGYDRIANNQMLVADRSTGEIRRFLTGPRGCEITGITMTPDQKTLFVNIQHPGESTTFWNNQPGVGAPTVSKPNAVSSWPFGGTNRPRPATVVIRRNDGGKIGA
jgi:secreted PhoX family phosphatase